MSTILPTETKADPGPFTGELGAVMSNNLRQQYRRFERNFLVSWIFAVVFLLIIVITALSVGSYLIDASKKELFKEEDDNQRALRGGRALVTTAVLSLLVIASVLTWQFVVAKRADSAIRGRVAVLRTREPVTTA